MSNSRRFRREDYSVGWVCALPRELTAAIAMLDERHDKLLIPNDNNNYTLGNICGHNVVMACLPAGRLGLESAAVVASNMKSSFPNIRFGLMVGIGGGVPQDGHDIRLGDVVVSQPGRANGGVVQYDFGRTVAGGQFVQTGALDGPPNVLLTALATLQAEQPLRGGNRITEYLNLMLERYPLLAPTFGYPGAENDQLFQGDYDHVEDSSTCNECDMGKVVHRSDRQNAAAVVHYGTIASGNQVMKHGATRDRISRSFPGGVLCFEMEAAGLMNDFRCIVVRGVCDYADSHKNDVWQDYASATAATYSKEVLSVIAPSEVEAIGAVEAVKVIQSFYTSDYESHRRRNSRRVPGTCDWIIHDQKYLNWRANQNSNILLVTAGPGCGKSVLASFLVDELNSQQSQTILPGIVCHFFFRDDDEMQKSATRALCALLHQLFTRKPELIRHAMDDWQHKGEKVLHEFGTLWAIFKNVMTDPQCGKVFCVMDGLDECELVTRNLLLNSLANDIQKKRVDQNLGQLRLVALSRPYVSVERQFSRLHAIRIRADKTTGATSRDIELFVKARITEIGSMKKLNQTVQADLEARLIGNADRTFLWVSLVLDMVENSARASRSALEEILSSLPTSVEEAFEKILQKCSDIGNAKKLLHIVVAATRPLSLDEINVVFTIRDCDTSHEDLDLEPWISTTIQDLCGLFLKIVDSKVYLIHHTAKEFLTCTSNPPVTKQHIWKHCLGCSESNLVLANSCVLYLQFLIFETHPLVTPFANARSEVREYIERYPFLDYAAKNWAEHFRLANVNEETATFKLALKLYDISRSGSKTWCSVYGTDTNRILIFDGTGHSALAIASHLGHNNVVRFLLEHGYDTVAQDVNMVTVDLLSSAGVHTFETAFVRSVPLHEASDQGYVEVVRSLLDAGANIEEMSGLGFGNATALSIASTFGFEAVVRLLLSRSANVDAVDLVRQTPLHKASTFGYVDVVRLLLKHGADVRARDCEGKSPLLSNSSWAGNEVVASLLLEHGADVMTRDVSGNTALHYAAMSNRLSLITKLLEKNAEIEAKSYENFGEHTPLLIAAAHGRAQAVSLLLESGADITAKGNDGATALHLAAKKWHKSVLAVLLEKGADRNLKDFNGWTPLHLAVWGEHEISQRYLEDGGKDPNHEQERKLQHQEVLVLLIANGADINATTQNGKTVLHLAVQKWDKSVLHLLLERKADLTIKTCAKTPSEGLTALQTAILSGNVPKMELLVQKGAEITAKMDDGTTSLALAIGGLHKAAAEWLLDNGADVNERFRNRKFKTEGTALHMAAADDEDGAITKLLLSRRADTGSRLRGLTPLHLATICRKPAVIKHLLDAGADIRAATGPGAINALVALAGQDRQHLVNDAGWMLLRLAVWADCNEEVIRLFLDKGADIHAEDENKQTILHIAARTGSQSLTRLLLTYGSELDARDRTGDTALDYADSLGHRDVAQLLLGPRTITDDNINTGGSDIETDTNTKY